MIDKTLIRDFPPITATIGLDSTGVFRVGATEQHVAEADETTTRKALVQLMQAEASKSGRPVRVTTTDAEGMTVLLIDVDGDIEEESYTSFNDPAPTDAFPTSLAEEVLSRPHADNPDPKPQARPATAPTAPPTPANSSPDVETMPKIESDGVHVPSENMPRVAAAPEPAQVAPPAPTEPAPTTRRELRDAPSFLAPATVGSARRGVAGLLNSVGFNVAPSAAEISEREDVNAVSRHFPRRRTVSIANRKGGASKTPTTVELSAIFARYGGGGVAAWDNNETMGTLGWRTEQGGHDSTVLDLIGAAENLLSPGAEIGQLAQFMHHQPADKFDVLRSAEDGNHVVSAVEVDLVHRVLAKYYRLIIMDSGNSAGAPNWQRMIELTDQLVIPSTTVEDRKEGARLTLKAVSEMNDHGAHLAHEAVVIISEVQPKESSLSQQIADQFRPYVREVVIVPFDPALKSGIIHHDALRSSTRRAWLAAAAAVARGL